MTMNVLAFKFIWLHVFIFLHLCQT